MNLGKWNVTFKNCQIINAKNNIHKRQVHSRINWPTYIIIIYSRPARGPGVSLLDYLALIPAFCTLNDLLNDEALRWQFKWDLAYLHQKKERQRARWRAQCTMFPDELLKLVLKKDFWRSRVSVWDLLLCAILNVLNMQETYDNQSNVTFYLFVCEQ